jgi:hypothetical protein
VNTIVATHSRSPFDLEIGTAAPRPALKRFLIALTPSEHIRASHKATDHYPTVHRRSQAANRKVKVAGGR